MPTSNPLTSQVSSFDLTNIQLSMVGLVIELTVMEDDVAVDISAASVKKILFKKPDGTFLEKSATFSVDGTDGKIRYSTIAGDLNIKGIWSVQAYIEISGWRGYSSISRFEVHDNLGVVTP